MANYAILFQTDNSAIKDLPPWEVYERVPKGAKRAADVQLMVDEKLFSSFDSYNEFTSERAKKIANELNRFLEVGKK